MATITGVPALPDARPYRGPCCFIRGATSDYVRDEHLPRIRALFPNAELRTIEGAGHWLHAERPREFLEALGVCLGLRRPLNWAATRADTLASVPKPEPQLGDRSPPSGPRPPGSRPRRGLRRLDGAAAGPLRGDRRPPDDDAGRDAPAFPAGRTGRRQPRAPARRPALRGLQRRLPPRPRAGAPLLPRRDGGLRRDARLDRPPGPRGGGTERVRPWPTISAPSSRPT